ncbi:MAG: YbaB/EbfC family nucleoid-associated protein [Actinobacteria bacterium]|nr:YbaB/EbfC family nucleoid-associated protein [Actinomycetota bacterium]
MRPQDMRKLMQQAQQMQERMASVQQQLAETKFEGSAGGGVVKATVTGGGSIVSVDIDPSVIDPEDPEMLGDLVVAAVNQALEAASGAAEQQMGTVTGGLGGLGDLLG